MITGRIGPMAVLLVGAGNGIYHGPTQPRLPHYLDIYRTFSVDSFCHLLFRLQIILYSRIRLSEKETVNAPYIRLNHVSA